MDKREGIGLPSSLVNDAVRNMDVNSQKAVNQEVSGGDRFDEMTLNAQRGAVDRPSNLDNFDSTGSFGNLVGDTRGSAQLMANPIVAEEVGSIDYIKWFSELKNTDVKTAGGKGASLGEMYSNKFPVPPGFVITAQAYEYFLKSANADEKIKEIIDELDVDDTTALNQASRKIREIIEGVEIPSELKNEVLESYKILGSEDINSAGVDSDALTILKNSQDSIFVSVRSSATTEDLVDASFAGQQESFLNVKGTASLIEHVKRCFSSLYTPRAIFYRKKKGFSGALIAVVVQKMVDSEKSGVVFSRDPVKLDENVAMEAVFGLGEGIVSGKIHPDNYVVDRELEIKDIKITNKKIAIVRTSSGKNEIVRLSEEKSKSQVLTRGEIKEVADFAMKLEEHYKKPQDIEFAIEGREVYIIQSRPITTLGNKVEGGAELKGNVILEGLAASPGVGVGTVKLVKDMKDLENIKKGDVMVTEMTNPDMVVSMQKSVAIVTDEGGMTSHAAIVSREMGIPAIVGTSEATIKLKDGMKVTVDGFNGKVYEGAVAQTTLAEVKEAIPTEKVKLKVIVDLPDYAERAAESKIDSVGLTRLEGIIASLGKHPLFYEKEGKLDEYSKLLEEGIKKIAKPFKSVWIRASDIRTDEYGSLKGALEREINPMLGFHGVRFSLKHPEILKAELAAIREVAEYNPEKKLGLMFPQIISIEEVLEAKKYFNEFKTENMEFGVMIETPAAVQIIEEICDHVDFISFGTNDLTQYTLAVDRGEDNVQYLYNELHPAIFSQIGYVIDVCKKKNVVSSICGQAGSKKEMAEFLFKRGINSISVNADAAYKISKLISELEKNSFNEVEEISERSEEKIDEEIKVEEQSPAVLESEAVPFTKLERVEDKVKKRNEGETGEEDDKWDNKAQIASSQILSHIIENKESEESNAVKNEALNGEERKRLKKKKKWEKFKKWKAKKKREKSMQRKEREDREDKEKMITKNKKMVEEDVGWDKKGEVGLPKIEGSEPFAPNPNVATSEKYKEEVEEKIRNDAKKFNEEVKEENPYNDNLLHKDSIAIGAEDHSEHAKREGDIIEKVDNLDSLNEEVKEVKEEVRLENEDDLRKKKEYEESIQVEVQKPSELKETASVENVENMADLDEEEDIEEKAKKIEKEIKEEENGEKVHKKMIEREEEMHKKNETNNNIDEGENDEGSENSDNVEGKSEAGGGGGNFEEIGVYNPDDGSEDSQSKKQKYNYDFDDW